jgi:hypothetical protein
VAVLLKRRLPLGKEWVAANLERAEKTGRRMSHVDQITWGEEEVRRALRAASRRLDIQNKSDIVQLGAPLTSLFRASSLTAPGATVGTALGLLDQPADVSQLNKMQSPNTRDKVFVTLHQRHLLRWEKQLAMRGNARNLTEDGICGHQKLFVTSEFKRFVQFRDMLFPDAVFSVDGSTRRAATQKGGSRAVAAFLMTQDGDSFTSVVLAEATGALPNHLRRILSSSIVVCRFPLRFDPGFPLRTDPA